MASPDYKRLAAETSVQHGIRVDPDDPMMAVVTLNRLVLDSAVNEAAERVCRAASTFNDAAERLQLRAGSAAARELRECAVAVRQELVRETANFAARATELLDAVYAAHSRSLQTRWVVTGLVVAMLLFLCGIGVGRIVR
jgi:hypothetical protein